MRIKEGNKWKTAFQAQYGYFRYQVMSFGLSNALASFEGYINKILAEKLNIFVIIYLDNIFIYTKDPGPAHGNTIWWILKELKKYGFFANLKKCQFHKDKVCFLRYIVLAQRVQKEDKRIEVMKNWSESKSVYDIQIFLGFANFYQRFI